MEWKLVYIEVD